VTDEEMLAETRAFNAQLELVLAELPQVHTLPPEETRRARREGRGVFPPLVFAEQARDFDIGGGVHVRVIEPEAPRGAYLHVHGGGWTIGSADGQDPLLVELAELTRMTMVSVEYRLAPEHPYPAAADDCEAAARWLLDRYDGRVAASRQAPTSPS
jgi:acetyl esterase